MSYRNKTYIAFDADTDIRYYRLMQAWSSHEKHNFSFYNAHDINNLMHFSSEETIKRKLAERLQNTKVFILLVWEKTKYLYKFVRWEIEQAIKQDIPIIVVNLNWKRSVDNDNCPAIARDNLSVHISFNQKIIDYAIINWPNSHTYYQREWKNTSFYYVSKIYEELWL